ncbi:type VI secretion system Vgr family protein [Chondromyces apiculatus]|uniref:VgrG protein n=1 Tax=Chondromyces apiculatus DSM 436 TaxID=1192034 RepID=A0A017T821_9BACT|nr:type VI secretion system tip protein TssI/VgrG [Chondromyces apiculatus]EYF05092.1 VgrG protein [Chondromyces apiculatus DSM 436]
MGLDDFVFACEGVSGTAGPWDHLRVARFDGEEGMNRPFRYEVLLLEQAGSQEVDPESLVGKRATLRIATGSQPAFKVVHGLITEAEDAAEVPEGSLYRVVLEPPLVRARHRKRSRIFLDKTLRQIVETVLRDDTRMTLVSGAMLDAPLGGPTYKPAREQLTWRIAKGARLDNPRSRPYVVQYNESDLDFVSRLLEEEGISYHLEHDDEVSLLVLSDGDAGRPRVADDDVLGPGKGGRELRQFRLGGRLRAKAVRLGEHSWENPALVVDAEAREEGDSDLAEHVFPGSFLDSAEQGQPLAQVRLDRLHSEASFAVGEGSTRVLSTGMIFAVEHPKARYEGEYLVTRLRTTGHQAGVATVQIDEGSVEPFRMEVECACRGRGAQVAESRFQPERRTPKPRIAGAQTAFVTAEPSTSGAEVNLGGAASICSVRLAFHWDTDLARRAKEPSSMWVRVSQPFARGGQGGLFHPRVGVEVIVEFEEGDPDRPVVTGRVYNGKNRPPQTAPTHSSLWSLSTPGGGVRNEISFEDTAGSERIYTNAGKDMTTVVGNNRAETVGASALMTVGGNNAEQIGGDQTITIGANDTLTVGGNQTEIIGANQIRIVGGNRTMVIGANETRATGANHVNVVGGALDEGVGAAVTEDYGASRTTSIAASWTEDYGATRTQTVGALTLQSYGGNQTTAVAGSRTIQAGAMLGVLIGGNAQTTIGGTETIDVGAATIHVAGGPITHKAASLDINAWVKIHLVGVKLSMFAVKLAATAKNSTIGGVTAAAKGTSITFNGLKIGKLGLRSSCAGAELEEAGVKMLAVGVLLHPSGIHIFS